MAYCCRVDDGAEHELDGERSENISRPTSPFTAFLCILGVGVVISILENA